MLCQDVPTSDFLWILFAKAENNVLKCGRLGDRLEPASSVFNKRLFSEKAMNMEAAVIFDALETELDFIEEMRLRTWARKNYVPTDERDDEWHPVILDEMSLKDGEAGEQEAAD